uniref:Peptidase_M14 domain-containing protein n=1 Tax=Heterorhabditis bacteriophora TaxID=37862 RepID=A0A1I7XUR7_HETBA
MRRATITLLLVLVAFSCFNFWLYLRLLNKTLNEEQYIIIPTVTHGDRFCVAYNVTKARRSENFALKAKKIANDNIYEGSKRLIVVRRFELESNVHVPKNITILRKYIDMKMAYEFHHKLFPIGHTIEGLWQWFHRSSENVEPLVWEISYNLFNVHRGVKRLPTDMDSAVKNHQSKLKYSIITTIPPTVILYDYLYFIMAFYLNCIKSRDLNSSSRHTIDCRSELLHSQGRSMLGGLLLCFVSVVGAVTTSEWDHYHDYDALTDKLVEINGKCPQITSLYSIGKSVEERDLVVIQFSTTPDEHVASRDFPDLDNLFYELKRMNVPKFDHLMELFRDDQERQPETVAVGQWILSLPFVLSANLHEGDLVANYPFDSTTEEGTNEYSSSPDDGTFRYVSSRILKIIRNSRTLNFIYRWLAHTYANNHAHMAKNDHPPCDGTSQDAFARQGGITNGAKWYSVSGGMQDFNYLATNTMEITLELSCEKMPSGQQLPQFWEDNKKALIEYMWTVHSGIKGTVIDAESGEPINGATVWVRNGTATMPIKHPITTWMLGDYYRILPTGQYEIIVEAEGYLPVARNVTVTNNVRDSALVVDFSLKPLPQQYEPTEEELAEMIDVLQQQHQNK